MVSPYLERPLRSYEEALRDRAERLAAQGHHEIVGPPVEAAPSEPVVLPGESHHHDLAALGLDDVLHDDAVRALATTPDAVAPTIMPLDAAPFVHGPLADLDLIDLNTPAGTFG